MDEPIHLDDPRTELTEFLALNPDTAWLDALFVDLSGGVRGKRYPRDDMSALFTAGMQFPVSACLLDATGACLDPLGRGMSDGDPDATCWPVAGTLKPVPWGDTPGSQVLMSMLDEDGRPCRIEPRQLALQQVALLKEAGLTPCCAFELEFYLLKASPTGSGVPRAESLETLGQVYRLEEVEEAQTLLGEVLRSCRTQGIAASVITSEYAAGQFEINLRHGPDAVAAADECVMFRRLVRAVARRHGARASFMAKPFLEQTGSGMHLHLSLLDEHGVNCFDDGEAEGTQALRHAIGGLLQGLPDAMALYAPNVNAFRRFVPGTFVPVSPSWGYNNRSVAVRVPAGKSAARRVEFRVPGADANPYLVLAAVLACVRHGLESRLDPGPAATGNACAEADARLPLELHDAIRRLRGSRLMRDALGPEYVDLYCEAKRLEARKFFDHIGPREYEWYL